MEKQMTNTIDTETIVTGVSTFEWDTTFTTTFDIINKEIKAKSTYPAEFNNSTNTTELLDYLKEEEKNKILNTANNSIQIQGKWGQWELALRGNGNNIFVNLPITSGTISFGEETGKLDNGSITVMVTLLFESQKDDIIQKRELVLTNPTNSQVSVIDHSFPELDPESDLELLVEGSFKRYFNTEQVLQQFRYVFSTININDKATGDFAWLKPSDTGYAVFTPTTQPKEENSLFSILCMTNNKIAPPYIQQSVDATVLNEKTTGCNAVLCISSQRFCEKLLITAAMKTIVGTTKEDYSYSTDGSEIHNVREITFKNVTVSEGKEVDLKIAPLNFSLEVKNDHLDLSITDASFSETLYTAYLTLTQRIEFETKKVGNKTVFTLKEGDEFKGKVHAVIEPTETAEIIKWVGVALDILSAITLISAGALKLIAKCTTTATAAAATVADAAASTAEIEAASTMAIEGIAAGAGAAKAPMLANRLLAIGSLCTVIGLPFTLVEPIAIAIGEDKFDKVPSLEDFAENFLSEISWNGIEKTTLLGARLNDALLLDFKLEE